MKVGIIGLGYVGLPLAVAFAEADADVVGLDVDHRVVERLARGESSRRGRSRRSAWRRSWGSACRSRPTTRASPTATRWSSACPPRSPTSASPTSPTSTRPAGPSPPSSAPGQLVVLESTTYPGTTRERLLPILEESGLRAGSDFHLAFSPERIDPGRTDHTIRTTPKVVGGLTPACLDRATDLYALICDEVVTVSSPEAAELTKLLENIFRSVNIALVNELAMLSDRMGIDIWEVVDAAATKPFGFMRFDPGPGMGGHCLPIDPFYLAFKAREYDFPTEFIELAGKINQHQPHFCVEKVVRALNDVGRPAQAARASCCSASPTRPASGDMRESPALKIARGLRDLGRRGLLPRPARGRGDGARPALDAARRGPGRMRRRLRRHGAPRGRLRAGRRRGAAAWWTSAGSRAASRPPTWSGSSSRRARQGSSSMIRRRRSQACCPTGSRRASRSSPWPPPAPSSGGELLRLARRRQHEARGRGRSGPGGVWRPPRWRLSRPARPRRTRSTVAVEGYAATPRHETVLFNLLSGFLGSFVLMRVSTAGMRAGWWPLGNVNVRGRHIHHFVPGILIAFGAGGAALFTEDEKLERDARGPVRRRRRADPRRGRPAARPPRRLLDPRGRPERPALPGRRAL